VGQVSAGRGRRLRSVERHELLGGGSWPGVLELVQKAVMAG